MPSYINYNFNFEWFISAFESTFPKKNYQELDEITHTKINNSFMKNSLNYKSFIYDISEILNIKDIHIFLHNEQFCVCCSNNYPYLFNTSAKIYNHKNKEEITSKLCYNCIYLINSCDICNYIFTKDDDKYIDDNIYICSSCSNIM